MKDRFLFFENFKRIADSLPDDLRLKFYDALTAYVFDGIEPEDAVIKSLIIAIGPSLNKEDGRLNNGGKRENAGRKPRNIENEKSNLINSNQSFSNTINLNQTKQKETKKDAPLNPQKENNKNILSPTLLTESCPQEGLPSTKKFVRPTVEEVKAYCLERNNGVDPEKWFDFYQSKGWRVGSQPMKDWKAAVRTWEKRDKVVNPAGKGTVEHDFSWV